LSSAKKPAAAFGARIGDRSDGLPMRRRSGQHSLDRIRQGFQFGGQFIKPTTCRIIRKVSCVATDLHRALPK
jgi:hypothetical protein